MVNVFGEEDQAKDGKDRKDALQNGFLNKYLDGGEISLLPHFTLMTQKVVSFTGMTE